MELLNLVNNFKEKFNIDDISKLKDKFLDIVLNNDIAAYDIYLKLIENDLKTDYLQKVFQYYEADRTEKMQDYTPTCLAETLSILTQNEKGSWVYDCCSGSGALTIQKWSTDNSLKFVCEELDTNVIPFLLFNLAVRNITAYVVNKNILTGDIVKVYQTVSDEKYSSVKEIEKDIVFPKCETAISNPPYNIPFEFNNDIYKFGVPPESNANYGFIQICLDKAENKSALILPNGVLTTENKEEKEIRKALVEGGFIESVIMCPDRMFESTSIPVCIMLLNKAKTDKSIEFIDMRQQYKEETRLQNGQYGGSSHTKRTYEKRVKVFTDEHIKLIRDSIREKKSIQGLCKYADIEDIRKNEYVLAAGRYIETKEQETERRPYKDIVNDLNRVIKQRNLCKLTINESLAKNIGIDVELFKSEKEKSKEIVDNFKKMLKSLGLTQDIEKSDYISFSKNKNEFKFENNSKEDISHILMIIMQHWQSMIYFLNLEENRYLTELRDVLLPDLMSGKVDLENTNI
ncbi:N-6 DNA Methylase [Peptoanaerobacter stomatis]|uniref:site-specific DNA-methyltransferase (adenine-specific) n=1 Tax=Peptoanaerobacter stomatis TaxID=796937 RepID=J6H7H1_9FIRM|nr:N-6 DNA methylase [Peptoanaerobacter stomatis]EJU21165.1 N-6 DNA Methylase [Peptoanaerobacter stomatis]